VIDGQHAFAASQEMRPELQKQNKPAPEWTTGFRCHILQDDLPLDTLQDIAGRQQARASAVHAITYHQTMQMDLQMHRAAVASHRNPSRHELLEEVYRRSGKTVMVDGYPVCTPALAACCRCVCPPERMHMLPPYPSPLGLFTQGTYVWGL
jgi:hypothetical protein